MTFDTCGDSGYPPSPVPCPTPTPTPSHTSAPPQHGPPGTAFTGPDLTVPSFILLFTLLVGALALVLSHGFRKGRP